VSTKISQWAPIALFIYKRPEHARRTIASLKSAPATRKARSTSSPMDPRRRPISGRAGNPRRRARACWSSRRNRRAGHNRGLANSIIAGTTQLCERHGRVVVVEDDLTLAPRSSNS